MFVMDILPDVPTQTAPVVIAMAAHDKKSTTKTDHTIGICHLIENPPGSPSAVNSMSTVLAVWGYLERQAQLPPEQLTVEMYKAAKLSLLQGPKHGTLEMGTSGALYHPTSGYFGSDRATVLVEIGDRKVKVLYFFNVMSYVPPGMEGYNPHKDKKLCPQGKGRVWKISLNPDDPSGGFFTFEQNYSIQLA